MIKVVVKSGKLYDVYLFTHEFSIDLMQATKSLDVSRGQKMPRSGLHSHVFILYSFLKHLKVAGIQCIKCEVCALVSEAVPVNEGQNEWVKVCRSCRGEQMMNTLQSFWGGPSSFVGAVKQLSGLTVGSWREGLVHNWKLSLEMSHVAVHLNFKPGDPCGRSACRDLTVPINPKFNIFVNRESPVGDLFIFNKGNVGQFQYERICLRLISVLH